MKFKSLAITGAAAVLLAGCSTLDIDEVQGMSPKGTAFQQALHKEYSELAVMERGESDWTDALFFIDRAHTASMGKTFGPQNMNDRKIPADAAKGLSKSRSRLMKALDGGGAKILPQAAARAQAGFDCWMQEQEENFQPKDIAACKRIFDVALKAVEDAIEPAKMAKPMMKKSAASFIVYFDFNSSKLNGAANAVISEIASAAYNGKPKSITVAGHTDRSGSNAYNQSLSNKRAKAVAMALTERGLTQVKASNFGESKPWMGTADGARQPLNRRVEVNFQ